MYVPLSHTPLHTQSSASRLKKENGFQRNGSGSLQQHSGDESIEPEGHESQIPFSSLSTAKNNGNSQRSGERYVKFFFIIILFDSARGGQASDGRNDKVLNKSIMYSRSSDHV